MTKYEILIIVVNFIMAGTSVVSCFISWKSKKEIIAQKNEINTIISNFKTEKNSSKNSVDNSGVNTGVVATTISGGVKVGSSK